MVPLSFLQDKIQEVTGSFGHDFDCKTERKSKSKNRSFLFLVLSNMVQGSWQDTTVYLLKDSRVINAQPVVSPLWITGSPCGERSPMQFDCVTSAQYKD